MKKITMIFGFFAVVMIVNTLNAEACSMNKGGEGSSASSEVSSVSEA